MSDDVEKDIYDYLNSNHLFDCDNNPHKVEVCKGKLFIHIPVVLAELTLQVSIDTVIEFPEPVLEIKDIKKQVKITQSRLLLPTNKLFVKGFVRKNIQYARPNSKIAQITSERISSNLLSLTVDIPFDCITEIHHYYTKPVMPEMNKRSEFDFLVSKSLPNQLTDQENLQTSDLSEFHQESTQYYNEIPFCELISSKIVEWDEAINRVPFSASAPIGEGYFTKMEEKMVVDITLKVLQKQQICIDASASHNSCDSE